MTRRTSSIVLMTALGGVLIVFGLLDLRETQQLRSDGVASRGTVTGRHRSGGKSRSHYLDVEFQSQNGQRVALSEKVSKGRYDRTKPGDTVPLHYLPSDPTVMQIGAQPATDNFWFFAGTAALVVSSVYALFTMGRSGDG